MPRIDYNVADSVQLPSLCFCFPFYRLLKDSSSTAHDFELRAQTDEHAGLVAVMVSAV